MKVNPLRFILIPALMLAAFGAFLTPKIAAADTPPDVLESYTVSITPQQDGTLIMDYALQNYCTYSDWPSDQPYLQVGVPTSSFKINDWGPRSMVVNAEPVNDKFVQLDFDRGNLPKSGDCFNLNFTVHQSDMVHPDPTNGNDTFEFYPAGWNFPINVKQITINWALPSDPKLILVTDPAPASTDASNMTWVWNNPQMDPSQMFIGATVKLAYDKSAFTLPVAPPPAPIQQPSGGGGTAGQLVPILVVAVFIIAALIILWTAGTLLGLFENKDGLGGDSAFDSSDIDPPVTYHTRSSSNKKSKRSESTRDTSDYVPTHYSPPAHYDPPEHHDSPSSSYGGGYGGSSGHSSGCASMPSCACACACAAGGKVGCMLKMLGIKIGCLKKVIDEMIVPVTAKTT